MAKRVLTCADLPAYVASAGTRCRKIAKGATRLSRLRDGGGIGR